MNDNELDLFDELDDEEIVIVPITTVEQAKEVDKQIQAKFDDENDDEEFPDMELSDEEIKKVEAKAVADAPDMEDLDTFINEGKEVVKEAIKKSTKTATPKTPAVPKVEYKGPRLVKVYGDEIFTEVNDAVTLEEIRVALVETYKFAEFSKDRTFMSMDQVTGIIVPTIKFEKKG